MEEAEHWCRKGLELFETIGLQRESGSAYHQLGLIAQGREQHVEAREWYRRGLEVFKRLGLQRQEADEYYQLGRNAEYLERPAEAEVYYRRALEIYGELGNPPLGVFALALLGRLRFRADDFVEALQRLGEAFAVALQYDLPVMELIEGDLSLVWDALGEERFAAKWQEAFGVRPPEELLKEFRSSGEGIP